MMRVALPVAFAIAVISAQTPSVPTSQAPPPAPVSTTPGACLKEVRGYAEKRRADVPAPAPILPGGAGTQAAAVPAAPALTPQQRALLLRQIDADRLTMAKACAAKFDVKTAPANTLVDLVSLYSDAAQPDLAAAASARALALKSLPDADRATVLSLAIDAGLREPKGDERNARLEKLSDQLDSLPAAAAFTQQWSAHQGLEGYYRYDDIDAGIIKHATWMMESAKTFTPDQRKRYGSMVVGAGVNMAEAWAGEGMNDKAIALLRRLTTDFADVPRVTENVRPELERLELVGTDAAPLTAPRWLNMPAGTTTLDLKGKVSLLEFSAHWCVPCQESYPGVNRLRAKYGSQGFQAVIATEMWGFFKAERPLDAAAEFDRDKTYFAEHELDVPIAVGDKTPPTVRNADGTMTFIRDPNDDHFKVGGIPQIMLVDKHGKIRLMMVGYDDANEPKLAAMIENLIKEK